MMSNLTILTYLLIELKFVYYIVIIFFLFLFWKLGIRLKDRLIRGDQSHRSGTPFKVRVFFSVWTNSPKLTPVEIELGTLR
jgi:hypothetical protein